MRINIGAMTPLVIVIVSFVFLIAGTYGLLIPIIYPNYKTYSILIIGVLLAGLIAGYIGYHLPPVIDKSFLEKISWGVLCASAVSIFVTFLSLFIILNFLGS